jgi:hypothetical protein
MIGSSSACTTWCSGERWHRHRGAHRAVHSNSGFASQRKVSAWSVNKPRPQLAAYCRWRYLTRERQSQQACCGAAMCFIVRVHAGQVGGERGAVRYRGEGVRRLCGARSR